MKHPLAMAYPRREVGALVFPCRDREVVVAGDADLLDRALQRCDGTRTLAEVLDGFPDDERAALATALVELERHALVVDRSRAFRRWHDDSSLPDVLGAGDTAPPPRAWQPLAGGPDHPVAAADDPAAALGPLLARRRSAAPEEFGRAPSLPQLEELLQAAYGTFGGERRSVPSAGALHPLLVHAALLVPVGPLGVGLWWHDGAAARLRQVATPSAEAMRTPFGIVPATSRLLERAAVVLVVSCDLERVASVYGNRGYRYAWFEAGAALQNAALAAAAAGVAVRALGGFDDRALATLLELPPSVRPLAGMAVG